MTLCASVAFHKVFEVGFSKATRKVRKLENSLKLDTEGKEVFVVCCFTPSRLCCAQAGDCVGQRLRLRLDGRAHYSHRHTAIRLWEGHHPPGSHAPPYFDTTNCA